MEGWKNGKIQRSHKIHKKLALTYKQCYNVTRTKEGDRKKDFRSFTGRAGARMGFTVFIWFYIHGTHDCR